MFLQIKSVMFKLSRRELHNCGNRAEESEHIATVWKVLERLRKAGLKVKPEKCAFMLPNITYLGHEIDATGIHPMSEKICAIKEAPLPKKCN